MNKSGKLLGKVALVTGGGSGIGRITALEYAKEGANVVVVDVNPAASETVANEINALGVEAISIVTDVAQANQVQQMVAQAVARFGQLDIAFNNAGIEIEHEPLAQASEADFDKLMAINVKGVWLCMKYEIEQMMKQGSGAIINTSSVGGIVGAGRNPIYSATKHAVIGLTRSAAIEYSRFGIRINAVCPGVIGTDMMNRAIERDARREKFLAKSHPVGRVGEAEEVARAVVFLSSDDASFVMGTPLMVDGGFTAI